MHFLHCEMCPYFRNVCVLDREMELFSFFFCDYIQSIPPTCSDLWYLLTNKQFNHVQLIKKHLLDPT